MAEYDFSKLTPGLLNLTEGYMDFAKEVIINRALPDLRDGLKPVNRRILYTLWKQHKKGEKVKCQTVVGETLKLHPHGDASVYTAMVLMVDQNGSMSLPVFAGQGNFGGVHTTDPPAASRYTEMALHPYADYYFAEMSGIKMIPNYDSTASEPELLPVCYPAVLCNSTTGIAVGFRSNIPSFNINDVLDLTMEYLKDGKCSTVICPDFVTGGTYVRNNKELDKLMRTGKAKLRLRGKTEINGKEITVVEFPYGKTIQGLQKQIQKANIAGVRDVGNVDDYDHGTGLLIACTARNKVQDVLLSLYRNSDLQYTFSADLMTVLDGNPIRLGVWGIIEKWVEWRREVLRKEYENAVASWKEAIKQPQAFIEVVQDKAKVKEFTRLALEVSEEAAIAYVLSAYADSEVIDEEMAKWIVRRRLNEFRTGGKYLDKYNQLQASIKQYEGYLADIDKAIYDQLAALKLSIGGKHPRRTEITTTDYNFEDDEFKNVDTTEVTYLLKDNFVKKVRNCSDADKAAAQCYVKASASATLVVLDNRGRMIRLYCEDLPYCTVTDLGTYIPRYCGFNEDDATYRTYCMFELDGSTKLLIYKDGTLGFLDTQEWLEQGRRLKYIDRGISPDKADILGGVINEPEQLFVLTNTGKLGQVILSDVKHKARIATSRVWRMGVQDVIVGYAPFDLLQGSMAVLNSMRYAAPKLAHLESESSWLAGEVFIPVYQTK